MICSNCKWGAHNNTIGNTGLAKEMHDGCKGDCGCQHKTGQGWVVKKGTRIPQMQVQSP